MIKDAEAHADEDKKFHELVIARNQADALIHATEKSIDTYKEKITEEEKKDIEEAIKDLKSVLDKDDKNDIDDKTKTLTVVAGKFGQRMDTEEQEKAQPDSDAADDNASNDDVVDAEFEEVKEEKKDSGS